MQRKEARKKYYWLNSTIYQIITSFEESIEWMVKLQPGDESMMWIKASTIFHIKS